MSFPCTPRTIDPSSASLKVGFPLYQDVTLLDFAGATQVFAFSGGLFTPFWISSRGPEECIRTSENVQVVADFSFDDHPPIDVLFVPGGGAGAWDPARGESSGVVGAMLDPAWQAFIRKAAGQAQWVGSVCVGAFILAAAGLFDGCEATTYWSQRENLALFPTIAVAPGFPRFVIDVPNRRFSGGGVSSSIDLALELVLLLKGTAAADTTQLSIQYAPDPPVRSGDPGQAPAAVTQEVYQGQLGSFIEPIGAAVKQVLGS